MNNMPPPDQVVLLPDGNVISLPASTTPKPTTVDRPSVVVLGAGLVGTLSAHYLAKHCNVVVLDAGPHPASKTSRANAGRFVPSLLRGDYAPSLSFIRANVTSQLRMLNPFASGAEASPSIFSLSSYGMRYLRATTNRDAINAAFTRLADLSVILTEEMLEAMDDDDAAALHVVRDQVWLFSNKQAQRTENVVGFSPLARMLAPSECAAHVKHLAWAVFGDAPGGGCALIKEDFSLDAFAFTNAVKSKLETKSRSGRVEFRFNAKAQQLVRTGDKVTGVRLDDGTEVKADHVVVAMGPWTRGFVKQQTGVDLPIMSVRGASLDLVDASNGPELGIADLTSHSPSHFQMTPYGSNVRLIGFAESASTPPDPATPVPCPEHYTKQLIDRALELFPRLSFVRRTPTWCGLRPVTPDLLPLVGRPSQSIDNLYVNGGHGAAGWTLAASTGYLLAQAVFANDARLKQHAVPGALDVLKAVRPDR